MLYGPDDYESRQHETPEARMFRERAEREAKDLSIIEQLLASLRPEDADMELFTFWERKKWGLKHTRKRAKNNDHEADGA